MDVKIFETKNLGFVIAEIDSECGCDEHYCVVNPHMIQMFTTPPKEPNGPPELQIQLPPLVYGTVLKDPVYETTLDKNDFKDVTDKFKPKIIELYRSIHRNRMPVEDVEEENVIELFD